MRAMTVPPILGNVRLKSGKRSETICESTMKFDCVIRGHELNGDVVAGAEQASPTELERERLCHH
jgi:hypothetical protein